MKDKIKDIIYSFQDNKHKIMPVFKIVMSLLGLLLIMGLIFGWFKEDVGESVLEGVYSEENYEYLSFSNVSPNEDFYFASADILIDNPVLTHDEVRDLITYINIKINKEAVNLNKKLSGVVINIYQRKIQYELGLQPTGLYSYLVEGNTSKTLELQKIPKEDLYVETFNYNELLPIDDIKLYDGDDILIETIELPDAVSDNEYIKILKLNEYMEIFESEQKALGFYVYYDMNIKDIQGDKYKDKLNEIRLVYKEAIKRDEYLPEMDRETLILDYRENHIDVWSNIVVYRGY